MERFGHSGRNGMKLTTLDQTCKKHKFFTIFFYIVCFTRDMKDFNKLINL
jgi:hypothetical protein